MEIKKLHLSTNEEILNVLGPRDSNLKRLEKKLKVSIFVNYSHISEGCVLSLRGSKTNSSKALKYLSKRLARARSGDIENYHPKPPDFPLFADAKEKRINTTDNASLPPKAIYKTEYGEYVYPRGKRQEKYSKYLFSKDIVVATGPAGTGKTFIAAASALESLRRQIVRKIVLTRPIVEAGEKLGFLPGDIYDKTHPYLIPLYDAFNALIGPERFRTLKNNLIIEIIPLAYMRGRTMERAFIILDEAQNASSEQMKMFLTRMGVFSKMAITGDLTQTDLSSKNKSGLIEIIEILKDIKEIKFIEFRNEDIARHKLVKKIVSAYAKRNRAK